MAQDSDFSHLRSRQKLFWRSFPRCSALVLVVSADTGRGFQGLFEDFTHLISEETLCLAESFTGFYIFISGLEHDAQKQSGKENEETCDAERLGYRKCDKKKASGQKKILVFRGKPFR